ncbi:DUF2303 family protein [Pseudonocardia acaciae]|uniref:DUF2303 family protein n=1 Tax=Pseudonocardia acaciae TaxID=551276 RepID=UPI000688B731|nr:DUF2303 family protein [Pseudonocardia acaciae]
MTTASTRSTSRSVVGVNGTAVAEAADLARQAEAAKAVDQAQLERGLVVRVVRHDERIEVTDLEHILTTPREARGAVTVYDPLDFISYLNRLATPATTGWADPESGCVVAVFDDHQPERPGWRQHRATLHVRRDPEWAAWTGNDSQLGAQEWFAEFIEDHFMSIVEPDAATMLEISSTFQAARNSSFERGVRLQSGDLQLRFVEETTAKAGTRGQLEVPERFTIRVSPYLGVAPVDLTARLRYRIRDGHLGIGYQLHRPDLAEQEAFNRVRAAVAEHTQVPVHLGQAPTTLRPHQPRY